MANLITADAGGDQTADLTFFPNVSGSVSYDTGSYYTGAGSYKCAAGSPAATAYFQVLATLADVGRGILFRINMSALPSIGGGGAASASGAWNICGIWQSFVSGIINLAITSGGLLQLHAGATVYATGTTVLPANAWVQIGVSYVITSATVWSVSVYIGGVLEFTVTNGGTLSVGSAALALGQINYFGTNVNVWFDDIAVFDTADGSWPGNYRVAALKPGSVTAAGTWSAVGTGAVNEAPVATANRQTTTTQNDLRTYDVPSQSSAGLTGAGLAGHVAWEYGSSTWDGSGGSTSKPNTYADGSGYAWPNGLSGAGYGVHQKAITSGTWPTGVGLQGSEGASVQQTDLAECGVLVVYTDPPVGPSAAVRASMGFACM